MITCSVKVLKVDVNRFTDLFNSSSVSVQPSVCDPPPPPLMVSDLTELRPLQLPLFTSKNNTKNQLISKLMTK